MVVVAVFPGWSGEDSEQRFLLLRERLEKIPGVKVEIVDYLGVNGPFTKLRTRASITELTNEAEKNLLHLCKGEERIIALGYGLGAIIVRILIMRGYDFERFVSVGGPHKGFSKKYLWLRPLAKLFGAKPFFELMPESDFLKSLKEVPPGIYIGSKIDEIIPPESAVPEEVPETERNFLWFKRHHDMIPSEKQGVPKSAIPVVARIIEKYVESQ